jgi:probable HAF family extracellular repeat protein
MVGLGDLSGSPFNSRGRGVSADGSVVAGQGNFNNGGNVEAFRWTSAGGMVGLGFIPGATSFSEAFAVSGNGLAIVGTASVDPSGTLLAFRWTAATGIVSLGDLPGSNLHSSGGAVNFDGSVVVGTGDIGSSEGQAYRWTQAGGMVGLGDLPGGPFNSQGLGVSGNGSVVVGSSATSTLGPAGQGEEAFIWDEVNGMRNLKDVLVNEYNLNLTGWTLYHAEGISPDGLNIVGWGRNPSGQTEAWVVHIPEPSTSALLSLGAGAFLRRRKQSGAAR